MPLFVFLISFFSLCLFIWFMRSRWSFDQAFQLAYRYYPDFPWSRLEVAHILKNPIRKRYCSLKLANLTFTQAKHHEFCQEILKLTEQEIGVYFEPDRVIFVFRFLKNNHRADEKIREFLIQSQGVFEKFKDKIPADFFHEGAVIFEKSF